jgi:serine/threonine protein phosphatase PrpC
LLVLEQGDIETALRKGFIDFDKEMASDEEMREDLAGTTAICVVIKDDKLYCGNVGDSRAIASINGNVEILSTDHKPNNDDERKRITAAGGWVEFNRVNGKNFIFEVLFLNVFLFSKEIWLYHEHWEILYSNVIRINVRKNKLLPVR